MRLIVAIVVVLALTLLLAAPAFAVDGSSGSGESFGQHHATMGQSQELGGGMNPGMHDGFSGWTPM